jgi:hypothetical protein
VPPSGAGVGRLWRITDSLSGETKTPGQAQPSFEWGPYFNFCSGILKNFRTPALKSV